MEREIGKEVPRWQEAGSYVEKMAGDKGLVRWGLKTFKNNTRLLLFSLRKECLTSSVQQLFIECPLLVLSV